MASIPDTAPGIEKDTSDITTEPRLESDSQDDVGHLPRLGDNKDKDKANSIPEIAARNSDPIPNIEHDTVIDNRDMLNDISDDTQDNLEDEDDFGSFDSVSEGDNNDFGDFDAVITDEQADTTPVFYSIKEAIDRWENVLNQIYPYKPLEEENFTLHSTKNIRLYVLEEAPESFHSRLTWDLVTKYIIDDSKIKVKWDQSEIESLYLNALSCKRSPRRASMFNLNQIDTTSTNTIVPNEQEEEESINIQQTLQQQEQTSTTSLEEKRSSSLSVFSSISKYLPHLSKSNLPSSQPTSPISPTTHSSSSNVENKRTWTLPLTPSNSLPRKTSNKMNVKDVTQQQQQNGGNIRRSNTVAFSSTSKRLTPKDSLIITGEEEDKPYTTKPRPSSLCITSSSSTLQNDLFDLDTMVLQPTASPQSYTAFKPLIPATPYQQKDQLPKSNTIGLAFQSVLPTAVSAKEPPSANHNSNNVHDVLNDFFGSPSSCASPNVVKNNDDPFGLNPVFMTMSPAQDSKSQTAPVFTNDTNSIAIFPTTTTASPTNALSPVMSSPTILSPTPITPTLSTRSPIMQFDTVLSPNIIGNKSPSFPTASVTKNDPFDYFFSSATTTSMTAVNDQPQQKAAAEDEDEWGDWTS